MNDNYILVSDWEKVEEDNFYLSDDWFENGGEDNVKEARELQQDDKLYSAYIVNPSDYAIYYQMDANEVFINGDGDVILKCESQVIGNDHEHREEYNY